MRIFFGSTGVGVFFGIVASLVYKYFDFTEHSSLMFMEVVMAAVFPYMAWLLAEAQSLSGIVAILFCGIVMAHYAQNNMSPKGAKFATKFFKAMATLAESFVFVYLGVSLASASSFAVAGTWPFVFVTLVVVLISRACNVFPLCFLANLWRKPSRKIPNTHIVAIWFSGLRGAIAFALASRTLDPRTNFRSDAAKVVFSTTNVVILFTVLVLGGWSTTVMTKLGVLTSSSEAHQPLEEPLSPEPEQDPRSPESGVSSISPASVAAPPEMGKVARMLRFDRHWIKPLLTRAKRPESAKHFPIG
mmetsp:Transcript_58560/g.127350  ORF Transcript_58560/g.127350 Transcript_58560/m.127350 type:complete len:302 (+) Transcript_58560:682-1587(+)